MGSGGKPNPWYEWKSKAIYPTASAIKTAYLVELFTAHSTHLDEPLTGLAEVLGDDDHPALAPFNPATRAEIRRELAGASARRVGEVMMGKLHASNAVYNAAANVTTAVLGGPVNLTSKIHARDQEFAPIEVRRYMLAPRDRPGDNEASASALAAVLQRSPPRSAPLSGRGRPSQRSAGRSDPTTTRGSAHISLRRARSTPTPLPESGRAGGRRSRVRSSTL